MSTDTSPSILISEARDWLAEDRTSPVSAEFIKALADALEAATVPALFPMHDPEYRRIYAEERSVIDAMEDSIPEPTTPEQKPRPDDSEADEMIADSEDLPEALFSIADKYDVPVTNNETRWQDGQFLRHIGDFTHDIKAAFERFPQSLTTVEWGVEERMIVDGDWVRVVTGHYRMGKGVGFTEAEARHESERRINGIDPATWKRLVSRRTCVGPWEVVAS